MTKVQEKFWARVEKTETCWLWLGRKSRGYGQLQIEGKTVRVHRFAWADCGKGEIPQGLVLDHLCRVRNCVNPAHLRLVTNKENLLAPGSQACSAINLAKTHCVNGHEFTPENTYHNRKQGGWRNCRACQLERNARINAARPRKRRRDFDNHNSV